MKTALAITGNGDKLWHDATVTLRDAVLALHKTPAVAIGVTHMDRAEAPDLDAYRTRLASLGHQPPPAVFRVDARSRDDVAMLVKALLYTLNPGLIDA